MKKYMLGLFAGCLMSFLINTNQSFAENKKQGGLEKISDINISYTLKDSEYYKEPHYNFMELDYKTRLLLALIGSLGTTLDKEPEISLEKFFKKTGIEDYVQEKIKKVIPEVIKESQIVKKTEYTYDNYFNPDNNLYLKIKTDSDGVDFSVRYEKNITDWTDIPFIK